MNNFQALDSYKFSAVYKFNMAGDDDQTFSIAGSFQAPASRYSVWTIPSEQITFEVLEVDSSWYGRELDGDEWVPHIVLGSSLQKMGG